MSSCPHCGGDVYPEMLTAAVQQAQISASEADRIPRVGDRHKRAANTRAWERGRKRKWRAKADAK